MMDCDRGGRFPARLDPFDLPRRLYCHPSTDLLSVEPRSPVAPRPPQEASSMNDLRTILAIADPNGEGSDLRSEERRVGKECRSRGTRERKTKQEYKHRGVQT